MIQNILLGIVLGLAVFYLARKLGLLSKKKSDKGCDKCAN